MKHRLDRLTTALTCALFSSVGCADLAPEPSAPPASTASPLVTDALPGPSGYQSASGLPAGPTLSKLSVAALRSSLAGFDDALAALEHLPDDATVRLFESYASDYPVFLAERHLALPVADGIFVQQAPVITAASFQPASHCGTSHICETFFEPGEPDPSADVIVVIAPEIQVAANVASGGASLLLVTERFVANDRVVKTGAVAHAGPKPSMPGRGDDGRAGKSAGAFVLYGNVVHGVRVDGAGQAGENGTKGSDATGELDAEALGNNTSNPRVVCHPETSRVENQAQHGGWGGNGGAGAKVVVRYATLIGDGAPREPAKTAPISDRECFLGEPVGCADFRCNQNPSITVCDAMTEADNAQCKDGIDNDRDGYYDCNDFDCSKNPYVTVCASKVTNHPLLREVSIEACTDGLDNDGDGAIDCADTLCKVRRICGGAGGPLVTTTGLEEASNAACGNGIDDDLDGKTDCADLECQYNPKVSACGSENTLEACSNGSDNDGDGASDCSDTQCRNNPYVKVCEPAEHFFLRESTTASCSDGLDNDNDHFKDCADYQCQNNPLASSVCGNFENTVASCSDNADNDCDGKKDCSDPHCYFNPFFGDFLCQKKAQTGHTQQPPPGVFNGVYAESQASFDVRRGERGEAGAAGKRLGLEAWLIKRTHPCEHFDDCTSSEFHTCYIGEASNPGTPGMAGAPGSVSVRSTARRSVDILRALLSPQAALVENAYAGVLFKRDQRDEALFRYFRNMMRLHGALAEAQVDCDLDPSTDPQDRRLWATLCPQLDEAALKLAYLAEGTDYYGNPGELPLNPRARFQDQLDRFETLYGLLDSAISRWLVLSNSLDNAAELQLQASQLEDRIDELSEELAIADARVDAAEGTVEGLRNVMQTRTAMLEQMSDDIDTLDEQIKAKYASRGLGGMILDLGEAVATTYLKSLASEAGSRIFDNIKEELAAAFKTESGGSGGSASTAPSLLNDLKDLAKEAAKNPEIGKTAAKGGGDIASYILSGGAPPPRSSLDPELKRLILSESQRHLVLDHLETVVEMQKAVADLDIARMERNLLGVRRANLRKAVQQIGDYLSFGAGVTVFERTALSNRAYDEAIGLIEALTQRYLNVLRQADYEHLPYSSADGASLLPAVVGTSYDFNLVNYSDMRSKLVLLEEALSPFSGPPRRHYVRALGAAFVPVSAEDLERFDTLGLALAPQDRVYRLNIDEEDPALSQTMKHRFRDLRVNVITPSATPGALTLFVARDTFDGFVVGDAQGTPWVTGHDLAPLDLNADGSIRSALHYQSLVACVNHAPSCSIADPSCITTFQNEIGATSCRFAPPGGATPANVTFYDRALLGDWFIVARGAAAQSVGNIVGVELSFEIVAPDM
jgi:hypothetical protein